MPTCDVCGVRIKWYCVPNPHRCNPRRLAKIDAAYRRAEDDEPPEEETEDEKWDAVVRNANIEDDGEPYPGRTDRRRR